MYHHGLGILIIILLTIIALSLLVGILAVCFWNLLLVLREFLSLDSKAKKRAKKNRSKRNIEKKVEVEKIQEENEETRQNYCHPVYSEPVVKYEDERKDEGYCYNALEKIDRKEKEQAHQKNISIYENLENMITFIKASTKPGYVYLKKKHKSNSEEIETDKVILEETKDIKDACLVIYGEERGLYIVLPYDEDIGERALIYGGIVDCFKLIPEPDRCLNYQIIGVKKACQVSRRGEQYYVEKKGELEIKLNNVE